MQKKNRFTEFGIRLQLQMFSVHLSHWKFTWCTLHKSALSQLCMEGMQSQCRLLPRGRIVLHLHFQCLQVHYQGFDQHIQTYCDGFYGVRSSGSHCTPVSRRRGRWSLQVSSTLFPWWKHSTLHTAHCAQKMLRVVRLKSHTECHTGNHANFVYQICTVSSLGCLVGKGS